MEDFEKASFIASLNSEPSQSSSQLIDLNQSSLVYQPLKLVKEMTKRTYKEKLIDALEKTAGLAPIAPDRELAPSFLLDFKQNRECCEFLIVITMYDEKYQELEDTLSGICQNLEIFNIANVNYKRIACIVIVDGVEAFMKTFENEDNKTLFGKFFNEDMVKKRFDVQNIEHCKIPDQMDADEFAHCFTLEYIHKETEIPLNLAFCVKHYNRRKLNTHLWFFGGFCEMIQPKYVMLLDVGTKPLENSLFYLYEAMELNDQLGGCCGEIRPNEFDICSLVVPAQFIEYKFAHMFDKALESVIGYITVLPGAFSAYRWEALKGEILWRDYFKSICNPQLMNAFQSNIYLAEDRVLCLSLVSKRNNNYTLRYVRKSIAETDVPLNISDLMTQRRRWINGSWFALIDSVKKYKTIYESNHSCLRKFLFSLQMLYYCLIVIYTWFIVGLYCLAFCITIFKNYNGKSFESTGTIMIITYNTLLLITFILSLGVKPKLIKTTFKILAFVFGGFQVYIIYLTANFLYEMDYTSFSYEVGIAIGGISAFFAVIVVLNRAVLVVLKGISHYVVLIPTYVNIFFIYSVCNVHDCSWGNRKDTLTSFEDLSSDEYEKFRTQWAVFWVLCNSAIAYLAYYVYKLDNQFSFVVITIITITGTSIIILRGLGAIIYIFVECCQKKIHLDKDKDKLNHLNLKRSSSQIHPSINMTNTKYSGETSRNEKNYLETQKEEENKSNNDKEKKCKLISDEQEKKSDKLEEKKVDKEKKRNSKEERKNNEEKRISKRNKSEKSNKNDTEKSRKDNNKIGENFEKGINQLPLLKPNLNEKERACFKNLDKISENI